MRASLSPNRDASSQLKALPMVGRVRGARRVHPASASAAAAASSGHGAPGRRGLRRAVGRHQTQPQRRGSRVVAVLAVLTTPRIQPNGHCQRHPDARDAPTAKAAATTEAQGEEERGRPVAQPTPARPAATAHTARPARSTRGAAPT